jgi:trimethylamine---corrinoid protein Co-methyltransferase
MGWRPFLKPLTDDDVALLRDKVLTFLEQKGVRVESRRMLDVLASGGAQVDRQTEMVRMPRGLVEDAVARAPRSFALASIGGAHDLQLPATDRGFLFRTNTGGTGWLDPETGEFRKVCRDDVATWAHLVNHLDNVDFSAFPSPSDVPTATADIHALRTLMGGLAKHAWAQPYSLESLDYLIELGDLAAGGAGGMRDRPVLSLITTALTPFTFKPMDTEAIIKSCEHGMPIHACSLPSAGGTSPITIGGSVLVMAIEVLAQVVMAQLVRPGHPVIGTALSFTMDMQNGRVVQSSPEAMLGAATAVQLIKQGFGVPVHTYGAGSDSPDVDSQTASDGALLGSLVACAGADVLGGGGQFEVATAISPLQLIIDDERVGMLRRMVRPTATDDEALGWQSLLEIAPGDSFLTSEHTFDHCREVWTPRLFTRLSREVWQAKGSQDLTSRAKAAYDELMARPRVTAIDDDTQQRMDEIVRQADAELASAAGTR